MLEMRNQRKKFQFTHPGGVRPPALMTLDYLKKFQFTHPGGVRLHYNRSRYYYDRRFNSRTREGCDSSKAVNSLGASSFQFTHPGGVRLTGIMRAIRTKQFQFTHPGGVRPEVTIGTGDALTFQFTHPGGVRLFEVTKGLSKRLVSIHAPGRGATLHGCPPQGAGQVSIHAPGRGATGRVLRKRMRPFCFNSRTREGCDPKSYVSNWTKSVSIHAPGRGATKS